jgi:cell division protein FtsQ
MRALRLRLPRLPRLRHLVIGAAVIAVAVSGFALWRFSGALASAGEDVASAGMKMTGAAGFELASISLTGRHHADKAQILQAIGIDRGGPILSVDPEQLRLRLEALDWIDQAQVRRILPGRLEIDIREATPIAIWQEGGKFALIDAKGRKITEQGVEAFAHLPLVVGGGAGEHAAELFALLDSEPTMKARVSAAVRVGDRRWNIRFDNNVDLLLPEFDAADAWHRLAKLESEHRLLARALTAIDMRLKDRMVVRLSDEGMKTLQSMRTPGRNT